MLFHLTKLIEDIGLRWKKASLEIMRSPFGTYEERAITVNSNTWGAILPFKEVESMRVLGANVRSDGSTCFTMEDRMEIAGKWVYANLEQWKKGNSWSNKNEDMVGGGTLKGSAWMRSVGTYEGTLALFAKMGIRANAQDFSHE